MLVREFVVRAAASPARVLRRTTAVFAIPALLAAGLVVSEAADAGLAVAPRGLASITAVSAPSPHPVEPTVRSYAVPGVSAARLRTISDAKIAQRDQLAALSVPHP